MDKKSRIEIRVSENEKNQIQEKANIYGMNMSQYIVHRVLKDDVPVQPRIDGLLIHLANISNCVNTMQCAASEKEYLAKEAMQLWRSLK